MSLATLERAIVEEIREVINFRGFKNKDLMEWSSGPVTPEEGEISLFLPRNGVNVSFAASLDHRK